MIAEPTARLAGPQFGDRLRAEGDHLHEVLAVEHQYCPARHSSGASWDLRCAGCETRPIPGLLQTEGYMRALLAECEVFWEPSVTEGCDRLAHRMERQRRMAEAPDGRMLRFVINEEALRATPPSATLLRAFYRVWELVLSRTASRRLVESLLKE